MVYFFNLRFINKLFFLEQNKSLCTGACVQNAISSEENNKTGRKIVDTASLH